MPKVSIIVPVYNVELFIGRTMESLLGQTLKEIEVILVDDESPDNCPVMCDQYALMDSRVKVVHKKNGGLGFARNSGLEIATGEYIAFLDSDDYVDTDTYFSLYTCAKRENIEVLYFCYERFYSTGYVLGHNETEKVTILRKQNEIRNYMLDMIASQPSEKEDRKIQMSACCAIYKREVIVKHNIRFHSERELISEDLVFNIDVLSKVSSMGFTPRTYYHYRINFDSLTKTIRLDRVDKNEQFYRYLYNRNEEDSEYTLRVMRLFIGDARFSMIQVCNSQLSLKDKLNWLRNVCKKDIWKEIYIRYPFMQMPIKYRIFFILSVYKKIGLIWIISRLKK